MITLAMQALVGQIGLIPLLSRTGADRPQLRLMKSGLSIGDPDGVWADYAAQEATFKGYTPQNLVPLDITGPTVIGFDTNWWTNYCEFPFDSGAAGDASNEIEGAALTYNDGDDIILLCIGYADVPVTIDADGQIVRARVPFEIESEDD